MADRGMCVGLVWVGKYSWRFSGRLWLYVGKMDLKAGSALEDEGPAAAASGSSRPIGCFAIDVRDLLLLLRTRVCASEKAVSLRGGTSARATGGGLSIEGEGSYPVLVLEEGVCPCAEGGFLSLADSGLRIERFLPCRGGVRSAAG